MCLAINRERHLVWSWHPQTKNTTPVKHPSAAFWFECHSKPPEHTHKHVLPCKGALCLTSRNREQDFDVQISPVIKIWCWLVLYQQACSSLRLSLLCVIVCCISCPLGRGGIKSRQLVLASHIYLDLKYFCLCQHQWPCGMSLSGLAASPASLISVSCSSLGWSCSDLYLLKPDQTPAQLLPS